MRVLITGGSGRIGKAVTKHLLQNGWDVRIFDRASKGETAGTEYVQGDILDYGALLEATRDCDTIIHLAAIPSPFLDSGPDVFQINTAGTFNFFEAAAANGIRRVVQASSINAMGAFYSTGDIHPQYFPIDEDHPVFTTDPYSFSKQMVEEIGRYYWRRDGISSVALRFPGVYSSTYMEDETYRQRRARICGLLDELVSQPETERQARLADARQRVLDYRGKRLLEFQPKPPLQIINSLFEDPLFGTYIADRFNFWAYIDERDAAQSLEKGLTADFEGAHALFINSAYNALGYDSQTLARLFFPEVREFKRDLADATTLISIERARALIGFEPEYSMPQRAES